MNSIILEFITQRHRGTEGTRLASKLRSFLCAFVPLCEVLILLSLSSCLARRSEPMPHTETPQRIISLVPAVTEILFAIGAGERVVGVTQYCDYQDEARTRVSVGGFSGATVSVEQIQLLRPDLVLVSEDMHERIVALLDDLNIPSFAVEPRNFSEVYDTIALIGEITGCGPGAEAAIALMKEKIAGVEERIRGRERVSVFWVLSEEPLMSAGAETFVSQAIRAGGGRNIFEDVSEHWPLVSPEQVLLRRPEWILLGSDVAGSIALSGPFWQAIPAAREGRVAIVDAGVFYRYGPRLADGVESIAKILHPGL